MYMLFGIYMNNIALQLDHINSYHARVMETVGQELLNQEKGDVRDWLSKATEPIHRNSADRSLSSVSSFTFTLTCIVALKVL